MSAAQELAERGYAVEVFGRNPHYAGGKARSVDVPGTNTRDPTATSLASTAFASSPASTDTSPTP
jgi:uncharacterized protein with NAD-binding domain and iron-sulfur cluster